MWNQPRTHLFRPVATLNGMYLTPFSFYIKTNFFIFVFNVRHFSSMFVHFRPCSSIFANFSWCVFSTVIHQDKIEAPIYPTNNKTHTVECMG